MPSGLLVGVAQRRDRVCALRFCRLARNSSASRGLALGVWPRFAGFSVAHAIPVLQEPHAKKVDLWPPMASLRTVNVSTRLALPGSIWQKAAAFGEAAVAQW